MSRPWSRPATAPRARTTTSTTSKPVRARHSAPSSVCWLIRPPLLQDATGPDDATRGIVVVYDIFGYFDQTIQGADILANSDAHHKYKVVMPDWYDVPVPWDVLIGSPPPISV